MVAGRGLPHLRELFPSDKLLGSPNPACPGVSAQRAVLELGRPGFALQAVPFTSCVTLGKLLYLSEFGLLCRIGFRKTLPGGRVQIKRAHDKDTLPP